MYIISQYMAHSFLWPTVFERSRKLKPTIFLPKLLETNSNGASDKELGHRVIFPHRVYDPVLAFFRAMFVLCFSCYSVDNHQTTVNITEFFGIVD